MVTRDPPNMGKQGTGMEKGKYLVNQQDNSRIYERKN
jgi:hypothetical protein